VDVGSPPTQVRMSETSAWCLPVDESGSPYLEVDFGENIEVCAVETKGYDDGMLIGYTKEFKLSFQADGENSFTPYTEDGETRVRTHLGSFCLSLCSLLRYVINAHERSASRFVVIYRWGQAPLATKLTDDDRGLSLYY